MKNKKNSKTTFIVRGALIASLYVVLTFIANSVGLASGAIQIRLSEALTLLPVIFPEAIGGLTIGCFVANMLTGCAVPDIVFGSVATLIGAYLTYVFRKNRFAATLPPIVSNALIVPFVLKFAYGLGDAWWYLCITVAIGEIVSCGVLGNILLNAINKTQLKR